MLTLPLPVVVPAPPGLTRADLGFPENASVFLFVFDFFSTIERKNPLGLIEAYKRAFPEPGRHAALPEEHQWRPFARGARAGPVCGRRPARHRRLRRIRRPRPPDRADRALRLLRLAPPQRGVRADDRRGDGLSASRRSPPATPGTSRSWTRSRVFSSRIRSPRSTGRSAPTRPAPSGRSRTSTKLHASCGWSSRTPSRLASVGRPGRKAVESKQSLDRAAAFLSERVPELERLGAERAQRETPASRALGFLRDGPTVRWDAPSRTGRVGLLWRRVLLRLLRPYLIRQRELETLLVSGAGRARALARPARGRRPRRPGALRRAHGRPRRAHRTAPERALREAVRSGSRPSRGSGQRLRRVRGDLPRSRGARPRAPRALRRAPPRPRAGPRRRLRARRAARAAARGRDRGTRRRHRPGHGRALPRARAWTSSTRTRSPISSGRTAGSLGAVFAST